jgi:hypothetical protein
VERPARWVEHGRDGLWIPLKPVVGCVGADIPQQNNNKHPAKIL